MRRPVLALRTQTGQPCCRSAGLACQRLRTWRPRIEPGGISMEGIVSAFNLPNHPSFSNPVGYLGSGLFGQADSTANLMLGSGSPTTGLTPLFQNGGPRTVELSLRFSF